MSQPPETERAPTELPAAVREFVESLRAAGLDLAWPFSVASLNAVSPPEDRLPLLGQKDALGLLFGNTRALWEPFVNSLASQAELGPDPLDAYVTRSLEAAVASLSVVSWLGLGHVLEPRPIPLQRIADAVGLARLGPAQLNVHPTLGPWFGLRAVVVLALPVPKTLPAAASSPCLGCAAPCRSALQAALSGQEFDHPALGAPVPDALPPHARRFLRVRDVCPAGPEARYGQAQIAYHYARARSALR
jgi:hypothetical protein